MYGTNSSYVTVNKLQKYPKPVFQKLGTLQFPSPNGLGFQVKKLIVTNLKVGKIFFPYPYLVFSHQNYPDIIYDQPKNESFCQKLDSYQYNAALAVTGTIRGTSQTKIYKEFGLESLKFRRYSQCALGYQPSENYCPVKPPPLFEIL